MSKGECVWVKHTASYQLSTGLVEDLHHMMEVSMHYTVYTSCIVSGVPLPPSPEVVVDDREVLPSKRLLPLDPPV